jgi:hypothetical protein
MYDSYVAYCTKYHDITACLIITIYFECLTCNILMPLINLDKITLQIIISVEVQ